MNGSIVLNNSAGRALRRTIADVHARDVLDCAGGFNGGDIVYITFRAVDGGQYVIATGVIGYDEGELRRTMLTDADMAVVRGQQIELLWP